MAKRRAYGSGAAVFGQISHQPVHGGVIGGIDQVSAEAPLGDQTGMHELLQVKGERGRRDAKAIRDNARRKPLGAAGHQHPEQRQPGLLGEGAESRDRVFLIHQHNFHISTGIKIVLASHPVNRYFVNYRIAFLEKIMDANQTKELVRNWYGNVAAGAAGCCGPTTKAGDASCGMGYSEAELASLPDGADLGLGCGNPQALAAMRLGEVVVDLGGGAGIDCFLAARQVGPTGRVIGVDMTHEMLAKARANAAKIGAANVEFRLGEIEHLPIADNSADVVISNCVINLVPDKAQVYREAFRVLRPGGRIAIADVVNTAPLPPELAADASLLCTCLAGAATTRQIEDWLAAAGFADIQITVKPGSRELVASWAPGRGIENYAASATIQARKPEAG